MAMLVLNQISCALRLLAVLTMTAIFILPLARADSVDVKAKEKERVEVFWKTLQQVVGDLDKTAPDADKLKIKKFLLHVAWHEGAKLTKRHQDPSGPGRSFFQFEPPRAKEAAAYAKQKSWLDRLATAAGQTGAAVETAGKDLPGEPGKPWPADNLIERQLLTNDLFAAYLARIAFKKIPAAIPADNQGQAEYWANRWKIKFSSAAEKEKLIKRFKDEADYVDKLIP